MEHIKKRLQQQPHELLSQREADELIARIVQKTRSHPLVTRGAGVRATLALHDIVKGYKNTTGRLDRYTIEKSALIALPHRIVVAPHTGKNAGDIIREITLDILWQAVSLEYEGAFKQNKKPFLHNADQTREFLDDLIEFQEQASGMTRVSNLRTHYVRQRKSGTPVSPEKLDYQTLADIMHNLEEQGILRFDKVGEGYRLQGKALLYLVGHMLPKDLRTVAISQKKKYVHEKAYTRKYKKGDTYRDVSRRHTLRQLVRRGKALTDITMHDLKSFEKVPLSERDIAVCIDVSESMARNGKLRFAKIAAAAIAQAVIKQGDRMGLVVFSNAAVIMHSLTANQHKIADSLVHIKAGKFTNIGDGIKKCRELLLRTNFSNTKHIIIISDGMPNISSQDGSYLRSFTSECSAMDTFSLSIGLQPHSEGRSVLGQDVTLMFMNMSASDYAVNEAQKSWRKNIKISFLYIGSKDTDGIKLARKLAHIGGGEFYNAARMQDVPRQALKMI